MTWALGTPRTSRSPSSREINPLPGASSDQAPPTNPLVWFKVIWHSCLARYVASNAMRRRPQDAEWTMKGWDRSHKTVNRYKMADPLCNKHHHPYYKMVVYYKMVLGCCGHFWTACTAILFTGFQNASNIFQVFPSCAWEHLGHGHSADPASASSVAEFLGTATLTQGMASCACGARPHVSASIAGPTPAPWPWWCCIPWWPTVGRHRQWHVSLHQIHNFGVPEACKCPGLVFPPCDGRRAPIRGWMDGSPGFPGETHMLPWCFRGDHRSVSLTSICRSCSPQAPEILPEQNSHWCWGQVAPPDSQSAFLVQRPCSCSGTANLPWHTAGAWNCRLPSTVEMSPPSQRK